MKPLDTTTVGGRIRHARQQREMQAKQLAQMAGITANHASMIEVGKRNPSDELLTRIAAITDTPFEWLKNGDEEQRASEQCPTPVIPTAKECTASFAPPDLQLFMLLLKWQHPELFPDAIKTILNVSDDTIEKLLNGQAEYEPRWRYAFPLLAQRLDTNAIRKAFAGLDVFLSKAESADVLQSFHTGLRSHLDGTGYKLLGEQLYAEQYPFDNGIQLNVHILIFSKIINNKESLRHYKCFTVETSEDAEVPDEQDPHDNDDTVEDTVRSIIEEQLSCLTTAPIEEIFLVFKNSEWCNIFSKYADDMVFEETENGHLTEERVFLMKSLFFVLIDEHEDEAPTPWPMYPEAEHE